MSEYYKHEEYDRAVDIILTQIGSRPRVGIILGSGLSALSDEVQDATVVPYDRIPRFPRTTVEGHLGRLIFGTLEGQSVVLMQGRSHYYEGVPVHQIAFPIRVLQLLGIETLIVTNAAGGIDQSFKAGDLMLITDHIGLVGMAGLNPLRGPNDPGFGPRFPDMTRPYDPGLGSLAQRVAEAEGIPLRQGVYVWVAGPSFETPAELRFLRTIGADAVGMSTVPEVIVARHLGVRVLGIAGISNIVILDTADDRQASHEEVLAAGKTIGPRLLTLIKGVLRQMDGQS